MGSGSEERLEGGKLSTVVRIGDTVRRPAGPWTQAVHALLAHLERVGFDAAPRALGLDEQGREILTYLPGQTVGADVPWPDWTRSEATLRGVGRLLRSYHEAVAGFAQPPGTTWRLSDARAGAGEIVCHNDVAPYNLVLRDDGSLAIIDWDVASPGTPAFDLAFTACAFAPMHAAEECRRLGWRDEPDRVGRLGELLDAYGLEQRDGFVALMSERLRGSIDRITQAANAGDPAFQKLVAKGVLEPVRAARAWIAQHRDELQAAITR